MLPVLLLQALPHLANIKSMDVMGVVGIHAGCVNTDHMCPSGEEIPIRYDSVRAVYTL